MDSLQSVLPVIVEGLVVDSTRVGGTEIDLRKYYVTPGKRDLMATMYPATTGSASFSSLVTKWMQASSSSTADLGDITGATFTAANDESATLQTIFFGADPAKPFLRVYHTLTGGGALPVVLLYMVKRTS